MKGNSNKNINTITAEDGGFAYSFSIISILLCSIIYSTILTVIAGKNLSVFSLDLVIIINYLLSPIAIFIAIGILRSKNKKDIFSGIVTKNFQVKPLIASLLIAFGLTFGLSEVNVLFVNFLSGIGVEVASPSLPTYSPINVIMVIIAVCLLPAVFEEFLFRGIILKSLNKTGVVFATVISGLLFSLFHMSPAQTVYQFIVGCLYSLIIIYGGNILYLIIIHFLNNLYIVLNFYYFNIVFDQTTYIIMTVVGLVSLILGVLLLFYKRKPIAVEKGEKKQARINFIVGAILGIVATLVMWIQGLI